MVGHSRHFELRPDGFFVVHLSTGVSGHDAARSAESRPPGVRAGYPPGRGICRWPGCEIADVLDWHVDR